VTQISPTLEHSFPLLSSLSQPASQLRLTSIEVLPQGNQAYLHAIMYLQDLPTELDVAIINYLLDCPNAVDSMVRVSKYYRKLGEPIFYHNIGFYAYQSRRVKQLLMTLLRRKDLRCAVRRFVLCHDRQRPTEKPPQDLIEMNLLPHPVNLRLCERIWAHTTDIQQVLN
jgi:hypothetical protein